MSTTRDYKCPVCQRICNIGALETGNFTIECYPRHYIYLNPSIFNVPKIPVSHMLSMIVEYFFTYGEKSKSLSDLNLNGRFSFTYNDTTKDTFSSDLTKQTKVINLYPIMRDYPINIMEKIDRILISLSKMYPTVGQIFSPYDLSYEMLFCDTSVIANNICNHKLHGGKYDEDITYVTAERERNSILEFMGGLEYIDDLSKGFLKITLKGWSRIEELLREQATINQGFIAMKFGEDTNFIREAFRTAIMACDFSPQFIDEKEHNNLIVPEIFFEIERSKFLVVDVTYPNYGAYYEAGYGLALKKEVIFCCREKEFKEDNSRPHFDIAQKSMIVWKDPADLIEKLKRRIEATVGLNN